MDEKYYKEDIWVMLPILTGWIGGVISYFVLKKRNRKKAKKALLIGVWTTTIMIAVSIGSLLYALGYF